VSVAAAGLLAGMRTIARAVREHEIT